MTVKAVALSGKAHNGSSVLETKTFKRLSCAGVGMLLEWHEGFNVSAEGRSPCSTNMAPLQHPLTARQQQHFAQLLLAVSLPVAHTTKP